MNKQEFLQLFELEDIYSKYQFNIPFSFGLHDYLTGTDMFIFFGFHSINEIKFCIEFSEFSKNRQELEVHFLLDKNIISINGGSFNPLNLNYFFVIIFSHCFINCTTKIF